MNRNEPLESDEWRPKASQKRKDTKHWCKGKVGREHTPEVGLSKWPYNRNICGTAADIYSWDNGPFRNRWVCRHELVCTSCGKIIKHTLDRDECPEG